MTTMLVPFAEAIADACGRVHAANDREHLRSEYDYRCGVLRGYYFAGATSEVELTAALDQLRAIHHARFMAIPPGIDLDFDRRLSPDRRTGA